MRTEKGRVCHHKKTPLHGEFFSQNALKKKPPGQPFDIRKGKVSVEDGGRKVGWGKN